MRTTYSTFINLFIDYKECHKRLVPIMPCVVTSYTKGFTFVQIGTKVMVGCFHCIFIFCSNRDDIYCACYKMRKPMGLRSTSQTSNLPAISLLLKLEPKLLSLYCWFMLYYFTITCIYITIYIFTRLIIHHLIIMASNSTHEVNKAHYCKLGDSEIQSVNIHGVPKNLSPRKESTIF